MEKRHMTSTTLRKIETSTAFDNQPDTIQKILGAMPVVKYRGEYVVSAVAIAEAHGHPDSSTVRHDFRNNKEHFVEGRDYFLLSPSEAKAAGFPHVSAKTGVKNPAYRYSSTGLVLFTKSGYLMLCKALTDETAWAVYKCMVSNLFEHFGGMQDMVINAQETGVKNIPL